MTAVTLRRTQLQFVSASHRGRPTGRHQGTCLQRRWKGIGSVAVFLNRYALLMRRPGAFRGSVTPTGSSSESHRKSAGAGSSVDDTGLVEADAHAFGIAFSVFDIPLNVWIPTRSR
jgi:hypothetical protein